MEKHSKLLAVGGIAGMIIAVCLGFLLRPAGPIVWFDCESIQNGVVLDRSGSGNHAMTYKVTEKDVVEVGDSNHAIRLDGGFLEIKSSPALQLGSRPYTLALWCKPDRVKGLNQGLITKCRSGYDKEFGMTIVESGCVSSSVEKKESGEAVTTVNALRPGEWCHVAVTFDPKGVQDFAVVSLRIYLNGIEAKTEGRISVLPEDTDTSIQVGHCFPRGYERYFHGLNDDVRIYSRTLNAREIRALWKSPLD